MSRRWIALFMFVQILGGGGIGSSILCAHAAGLVHAESGPGACATDCDTAPAACEPGCSGTELLPAGCFDCVDLVVSHTAAPSRGPGTLPHLPPAAAPLPAMAGAAPFPGPCPESAVAPSGPAQTGITRLQI